VSIVGVITISRCRCVPEPLGDLVSRAGRGLLLLE